MHLDLLVLLILWPPLAFVAFRLPRFWLKDDLIANQRIWTLNVILGRKPNKIREKLHELLGCHYCLSFHIAWIGTLILTRYTSVPLPVLLALAAWGAEPLVWRFSEDPFTHRIAIEGTVKHAESKYT